MTARTVADAIDTVFLDRIAELEAINADLLAALKKYGSHAADCTSLMSPNQRDLCDCGLNAAIAKATA